MGTCIPDAERLSSAACASRGPAHGGWNEGFGVILPAALRYRGETANMALGLTRAIARRVRAAPLGGRAFLRTSKWTAGGLRHCRS